MTTTSIEKTEETTKMKWSKVCKVDDLVANSGVCVLVNKKQIAVFTIADSANNLQLFACDNYDPIGKANVMSRGILGSFSGEICISSPLYKQHFSLIDGRCLEDEAASVGIYQTKIEDNEVYISMPVVAA